VQTRPPASSISPAINGSDASVPGSPRHGSRISLLIGGCGGGGERREVGAAAAAGAKPPQEDQQGSSREHSGTG